jgi:hypothetical protein
MIAAWRCSARRSSCSARRRSALARRLASSRACSCRALRSISLVLANRSTNTLILERRTSESLGLVAAADDLRSLVAVHPRHVDVEQDDRELAFQQVPERLLAGSRGYHLAKILEDALHREQIALVVVDQEDARALGRERLDGFRLRKGLHRDLAHGPVHLYSAASMGIGGAAAAAASRERATQTRTRASRSSMSTGLAI